MDGSPTTHDPYKTPLPGAAPTLAFPPFDPHAAYTAAGASAPAAMQQLQQQQQQQQQPGQPSPQFAYNPYAAMHQATQQMAQHMASGASGGGDPAAAAAAAAATAAMTQQAAATAPAMSMMGMAAGAGQWQPTTQQQPQQQQQPSTPRGGGSSNGAGGSNGSGAGLGPLGLPPTGMGVLPPFRPMLSPAFATPSAATTAASPVSAPPTPAPAPGGQAGPPGAAETRASQALLQSVWGVLRALPGEVVVDTWMMPLLAGESERVVQGIYAHVVEMAGRVAAQRAAAAASAAPAAAAASAPAPAPAPVPATVAAQPSPLPAAASAPAPSVAPPAAPTAGAPRATAPAQPVAAAPPQPTPVPAPAATAVGKAPSGPGPADGQPKSALSTAVAGSSARPVAGSPARPVAAATTSAATPPPAAAAGKQPAQTAAAVVALPARPLPPAGPASFSAPPPAATAAAMVESVLATHAWLGGDRAEATAIVASGRLFWNGRVVRGFGEPPPPAVYSSHRRGPLPGMVFHCSQKTFQECIDRMLMGMPDSVPAAASLSRASPGYTKVFLYNNDDCTMYGVFEARAKGGRSLEPRAWTMRWVGTPEDTLAAAGSGAAKAGTTRYPLQLPVELACFFSVGLAAHDFGPHVSSRTAAPGSGGGAGGGAVLRPRTELTYAQTVGLLRAFMAANEDPKPAASAALAAAAGSPR